MKIYLVAVALTSCAIASPALAGENAESFAGPKVGVDVGYDFNNVSQVLPGSTVRTREAASGPSVRGFLGYDAAVSQSVVVGGEFGIGAGGGESTLPFTGGSYSLSPRLSYDLTGRIGIAASPGLLLYGRAGVRWLRTTRETVSTTPSQVIPERSQTNSGFTYGAGAEFAVAPKLTLRTEFNHTRYGRDLNQNKISIGAAYHF